LSNSRIEFSANNGKKKKEMIKYPYLFVFTAPVVIKKRKRKAFIALSPYNVALKVPGN